MTITKKADNNTVEFILEGRLDTTTAPQLEAEIRALDVFSIVMDFTKLEYISSAGLRVLLAAQKKANANDGSLVVKGANADIREVFDITGFSDILTLE